MYPVPPSAARYGDTERIIGNWLRQRPGVRSRIVLATKAAGPVRGYDWLRKRQRRRHRRRHRRSPARPA